MWQKPSREEVRLRNDMIEKIYFENSKGNKLCGILSNPTENKDKPVIILCHGFTTSKNSSTYVRLEKILNENGISTFRFDFFGHGESEGKFEDVTTSEAAADILNAIKFLKNLGYSKSGLVGSSFGGMASIIAASKTDDLFILALKSPVSDYLGKLISQKSEQEIETWRERGYIYYKEKLKLNYSFFEDAGKVNGHEAAEKIRIPTLIVHGDKDDSVPIEQSKKTANLIENCKLEIIEGADHYYSKPEDFEKMLDLISKFIIKNS
jgi:dipeptidyl aminopeptidase/acylaminoacyl peptidase